VTKLGLLDRSTADELFVRSGAERQSFTRLAISKALLTFGAMTGISGIIGLGSDHHDAVVLLAISIVSVVVGAVGRKVLVEAPKPSTSKILTGLVVTWTTLVALGTIVYMGTSAIDTVDGALLESAAGFSTTSLTVVDPSNLSTGLQIWRAATQWFGGLLGLLIGVIALPQALRGSSLLGRTPGSDESAMMARPGSGRRQVTSVYAGFTVAMVLAYAASGLSALDSVVHGLTTVSTGGFSSRADSFVAFGSATRVVAIAGMTIAGSGYFIIWWALRGRIKPLIRSSELRIYLGVIATTTALLAMSESTLSIGDSVFTTVSAVSTTGYSVTDWTLLGDFPLTILLVVVAMGSMAGSAGGGLRVLRVHTLMKSVTRELRLQLDPLRVMVIKNSGQTVEEKSIDRISGYHIAHIFMCGAGAFLIAVFGVDVVDSIWLAVGTLSSLGPAPGVGAFGYMGDLSRWIRIILLPMMLAARLSVLVVLLGFARIGSLKKSVIARGRRLAVAARQ